jgi:uncharacterized protein with PIN domain
MFKTNKLFCPSNNQKTSPKSINSEKAKYEMEIGEHVNLQEIENVSERFKTCPKCNTNVGFWVGLRREHPYVQCKGCGAGFELLEAYSLNEQVRNPERLRFLRK